MRQAYVVTFCAGMAATLCVLKPTSALALGEEYSATACMITNIDTLKYATDPKIGPMSDVGEIINPDPSTGYSLFCPIVNNEATITKLVVYGYASGGGTGGGCTDGIHNQTWSAQACVSYFNGGNGGANGGACGTAAVETTAGLVSPSVDISAWTSAIFTGDGFFVNVYLGCASGSAVNVVWSYQVNQ